MRVENGPAGVPTDIGWWRSWREEPGIDRIAAQLGLADAYLRVTGRKGGRRRDAA
jgi:hypothetical protein